ncbi:MAG: hypothetical protein KDC26_12195, partial [Armatimonadetes bacterium]|nr:hypothetical protein [Armatimonadota bacterium]
MEQKWSNGVPTSDNVDGRLFAFDVTNRLINENDVLRGWEDYLHRPWAKSTLRGVESGEWTSSVYAWKPSNLDNRIFAQNGGFLFGGIPTPKTHRPSRRFQFPKEPDNRKGWWTIDDARNACCLALRQHVFSPSAGTGVNSGAL